MTLPPLPCRCIYTLSGFYPLVVRTTFGKWVRWVRVALVQRSITIVWVTEKCLSLSTWTTQMSSRYGTSSLRMQFNRELVGVLADIVQVVVLAPYANTLLTVDHTREFGTVTAGINSMTLYSCHGPVPDRPADMGYLYPILCGEGGLEAHVCAELPLFPMTIPPSYLPMPV